MTVIGNPLWVQALTYAAADDRTILRFLINTQGVGSPTSLAVTQNGTPNMSVNVAAGQAAVFRTSSSPSDFYVVESPNASTNLTIAASDPTNPRIDLIIARVYDAQYSGGLNQATVEVVTGTPAASPVAPTQPSTSLLLATVAVAANATTVINANITDNRANWTTQRPANSNIVYTSSGTLTAAQVAGAKSLRIRVWGGGGGSGGCAATTSGTNVSGSAGGGSGSYAESLVSVASLSYPVTVTVGGGGGGGNNTPGSGGNGGASSCGGVTANGGTGGGPGVATAISTTTSGFLQVGSAGGAAGAGNLTVNGASSTPPFRAQGAVFPSSGGNAPLGGQGGVSSTTNAGTNAAVAGNTPGGGAGGGWNVGTTGAITGAGGGLGLVIVELIY